MGSLPRLGWLVLALALATVGCRDKMEPAQGGSEMPSNPESASKTGSADHKEAEARAKVGPAAEPGPVQPSPNFSYPPLPGTPGYKAVVESKDSPKADSTK